MLINLAFIKAVNGLFYFALDYIAELEATTTVLLVRSPQIAEAVRESFPAVAIRVVNGRQAAAAVWAASRRGEMVFTPSPHPIPGCNRQLVVLHDSYPFMGAKGKIKASLFFLAMRTSRSVAGYINISDARAFLLRGGLSATRLRPSPNHMALPADTALTAPLRIPERPVIGLFGTDSPKKNYDRLFAALAAVTPQSRLSLKLYGQQNAYSASLLAAFPDLDISICDSADQDLEEFVRSVDIVASGATREGFSRPIAIALSLGIPCWIVDAPVFREFYGQAATFHADTTELSAALAALAPGMIVERPNFTLSPALKRDFQECTAWLKAQDLYRHDDYRIARPLSKRPRDIE